MELEKLLALDVSSYVEQKNGLSYLSWANAWREFIKICPKATYTILKDEFGNCYFGNEKLGYMVFTTVTVEDLTHEMWLPVMDYKNKSMLTPTTFDINKSIMRCLTKNLAMFGLGLYIYAGEDLPEDAEQKEKQKEETLAKITPLQAKTIKDLAEQTSSDINAIVKYAAEKSNVPVGSVDDFNTMHYAWASKALNKKLEDSKND